MTNLTIVDSTIQEQKLNFENVISDAIDISFAKEANFALQAFKGNQYLTDVAAANPESLRNAIVNVAAIGISLNPATKYAYLVPRGGKTKAICLDVSYMGLAKLATDSGSILWVQAKIVYANDTFIDNGIGEKPTHQINYKKERGAEHLVYSIAKTTDGEYLTEIMTIEECDKIRDRSEAWKAHKKRGTMCPWVTDREEMLKKTVVKRASKMWPKTDRSQRFDLAVQAINEHEGIDFKKESRDVTPPTENELLTLSEMVKEFGKKMGYEKPEEKFLDKMSKDFDETFESIDQLNQKEVLYAIGLLGQHVG